MTVADFYDRFRDFPPDTPVLIKRDQFAWQPRYRPVREVELQTMVETVPGSYSPEVGSKSVPVLVVTLD